MPLACGLGSEGRELHLKSAPPPIVGAHGRPRPLWILLVIFFSLFLLQLHATVFPPRVKELLAPSRKHTALLRPCEAMGELPTVARPKPLV
jgi:hypothetical protein